MVEEFDELERELREQLQPRSAPPGFAARVVARAAEQQPDAASRFAWLRGNSSGSGARHPVWQWATVAAAAVAMLLGGVEHQHQQRIEGEQARAQVMLALRITAATLKDVNEKINQPVQASQAPNTVESR